MSRDSGETVERFAHHVDGRPDLLVWLQGWYLAHCDGDWDREYGVQIETLANPGWRVRIDLAATELEGHAFAPYEAKRSADDWIVLRLNGDTWEAACGPLNLGEALHHFRLWTGDISAP